MIEHENQRMRTRISTNGGYVNSHNDYVMHRYEVFLLKKLISI